METSNNVKQNVKKNERQTAKEQKVSGCCGPNCCVSEIETKNKTIKEN